MTPEEERKLARQLLQRSGGPSRAPSSREAQRRRAGGPSEEQRRGSGGPSRRPSSSEEQRRRSGGPSEEERRLSGGPSRRLSSGEEQRRRPSSGEEQRGRGFSGEDQRRRASSGEEQRRRRSSGEQRREIAFPSGVLYSPDGGVTVVSPPVPLAEAIKQGLPLRDFPGSPRRTSAGSSGEPPLTSGRAPIFGEFPTEFPSEFPSSPQQRGGFSTDEDGRRAARRALQARSPISRAGNSFQASPPRRSAGSSPGPVRGSSPQRGDAQVRGASSPGPVVHPEVAALLASAQEGHPDALKWLREQAGGARVSRQFWGAVARAVASVPVQARAEVPMPAAFPAWRIEVEVADE